MHKKLMELKEIVKGQALYIKQQRILARQLKEQGKTSELNSLVCNLYSKSQENRVYHIVYCEMRGRTRMEIEGKETTGLYYLESKIKSLKEYYAWTQEEIEEYQTRKANYETLRSSQG